MGTDNIPIAVQTDETGSKVATRSRTEDAVTKHWERRHIQRPYDQDGSYVAHSGLLTVAASAQSTATGVPSHMFLVNPIGSGKNLYIQELRMTCGFTNAALVVAIATPLDFFTSTFTGTLSATPLAVAEHRASDAAAVGIPALLSTGLTLAGTPTLVSLGTIGLLPCQLTATIARASKPTIASLVFGEDDMPILEPGVVGMIKQTVSGIASDDRRLILEIFWREVSAEF